MEAGEGRLRTRPQVHSSRHRRRRAAPIRKNRLASLNHRRDGDALGPPSGASHAPCLVSCRMRELDPRWRSSARAQPSPKAKGSTCDASRQCSHKFSWRKRGNQRCRAYGAGDKRASAARLVGTARTVPAGPARHRWRGLNPLRGCSRHCHPGAPRDRRWSRGHGKTRGCETAPTWDLTPRSPCACKRRHGRNRFA